MKPLRCLIIDDEPLAHGVIENYATRLPQVEIVATCLNPATARETLHAHSIDLMFLDIQMPRMTGLDFLDKLENPPLAILTTAYEDYALKSYDFDVVDYLLKPFEFERFAQAIEKAQTRLTTGRPTRDPSASSDQSSCLLIRSEGNTLRVPTASLCYIEAMGDYTQLRLCDGSTLCCHQTLQYWASLLPEEIFVRIHRSYIVSLNCVEEVTARHEVVIGDTRIPIGRTYRRTFTTALKNS